MKRRESWTVPCPDCFGSGDETEAEVRRGKHGGVTYVGKRVGVCRTCNGRRTVDVEISRTVPVINELEADHA